MQLLLLLLAAALLLHDAAGGAWRVLPPLPLAAVLLLPKLAWGLLHHALCRRGAGRLAAGRDPGPFVRGIAILGAPVAIGLGALDLGVGALVVWRRTLGDWILLDEIVWAAPALGLLAWQWGALHRLDAATSPAARGVSAAIYAWRRFRDQAGPVLLPLGVLFAWLELVVFALPRYAPVFLGAGLQLAGALGVAVLAPVGIRRVWDTSPLPDGPVRERVSAICRRDGVGVRELLAWRPFPPAANAGVLGFVPRLRYVLLTELLVAGLSERELEAVVAHELGHIRKHHPIGLGLAAGALLAGLELVWRLLLAPVLGSGWSGPVGPWLPAALAVVGSPAIFGFVMRRFEGQADVFAAATLSGGAGRITPEAAERVCGALDRVALLNGFDPRRRDPWHGSIRSRQAALRRAAGRPVGGTPADRAVRGIVLGSVALLASIGIAAGLELAFLGEGAR